MELMILAYLTGCFYCTIILAFMIRPKEAIKTPLLSLLMLFVLPLGWPLTLDYIHHKKTKK